MVFVWIIIAIFCIAVFVGIVSLLGTGVHGDARERRFGLRRGRGRGRGTGRPTA